MDDFNQELNSKIGRMLDSKYFLAFIDKKLKQFRLHSDYDAMYIVVKTREIALEKIVSGEMLDTCLRRICLNVIKNLEEKTKSEKSVEKKTNDFNQELNSKIGSMLESKYFLAFIDHKLKQFRLHSDYDVMDVVVEAREVALEKIISGEIVENFDAWFRKICFNVIKNLAKETKSQKFVENKTKEVNREIYRMLKSKYFMAFFDYKLKQYRLDFYYDLMDVVLKAREIALGKIISGEIVENFDAWFRKICWNVIRNFYKKTKTGKLAESKLKNKSDLPDLKEDLIYATESNLKLLGKGWEKLSEVEEIILWLRTDNKFFQKRYREESSENN